MKGDTIFLIGRSGELEQAPHRRADSFFPIGKSWRASPLRGRLMRKEYDFSKVKRSPAVSMPQGKTRITIRLGINRALRQHIERSDEPLEETLRRVLREELRASSA